MDDARQKVICDLVGQAGRGIPQLDWLHQAILDAGYIRREDRTTKQEVRAAVRRLMVAMESLACDCAVTCGEHILDKVIRVVQESEAAEGAG